MIMIKVKILEVDECWDEPSGEFNGEFIYTVEDASGEVYQIPDLTEYTMLGEKAEGADGPDVGDELLIAKQDLY
jgi:hypothetical protein